MCDFMEVDNLDISSKLSKEKLMEAIKIDANNVEMSEIMRATNYVHEDAKFLPKKERADYIKRTVDSFISRLKVIKNDKRKYVGYVDIEKLKNYFKVIKNLMKNPYNEDELCFHKISKIVVLYAVFVKIESIHLIGTKFPGNVKLIHNIQGYMCPAKEKQSRNPNALCQFCVAIQNDNNF